MAAYTRNAENKMEFNGLGISWYKTDRRVKGNFKNGNPDGLLGGGDGMPMKKNLEMNYSEGKQHGDAVTWFENGR